LKSIVFGPLILGIIPLWWLLNGWCFWL